MTPQAIIGKQSEPMAAAQVVVPACPVPNQQLSAFASLGQPLKLDTA